MTDRARNVRRFVVPALLIVAVRLVAGGLGWDAHLGILSGTGGRSFGAALQGMIYLLSHLGTLFLSPIFFLAFLILLVIRRFRGGMA